MPTVLRTLKPLAFRHPFLALRLFKRKNRTFALTNTHAPAERLDAVTTSSLSTSGSHVVVIPTLAPGNTAAIGSTGGTRTRRRTIAKDALLLGLEALAQSADAFPPLKSVVGGLLFLVTQIELVSSNKQQSSDIYAQIDEFAASLVRAIPDATTLSPAHEAAIQALAVNLDAIASEMQSMDRRSRIARFLSAKRYSEALGQLAKRLEQANQSFTRTMLSSVKIKVSEIHKTVLPLRAEVHRLTRIGKYLFLPHLRIALSSVALEWHGDCLALGRCFKNDRCGSFKLSYVDVLHTP